MSDLYVHIPAALFTQKIDFLRSRMLQPEIACQDADIARIDVEQFADAAASLAEANLKTILHAPFSGFHPGTKNKNSLRQTEHLLERTLLLAERINAEKIVFHPGLEPGCSRRQSETWLNQSFALWSNYLGWAHTNDCTFCIENIYDSSPEVLLQLLCAINSPYFGHVFDIGHWNIFCPASLAKWLDQTAPFIRHLHLHDNRGQRDEHLAIGAGTVPFGELFAWLANNDLSPSVTLENHNLQALNQSLAILKKNLWL